MSRKALIAVTIMKILDRLSFEIVSGESLEMY